MKYLKTKFIAFVISRFTPDYHKIKSENKELKQDISNLKQDIYNLIRKENEVEGLMTEIRWRMAFYEDDMLMLGDATNTELTGILS